MSETDNGNISMPPPNIFVRDASGLIRWHPSFDIISISRCEKGDRILNLRVTGLDSQEVALSAADANHLAGLLVDLPECSTEGKGLIALLTSLDHPNAALWTSLVCSLLLGVVLGGGW